MHVCTYTHLYIHIYFTVCGPLKHQRITEASMDIDALCDHKSFW